MSVLVTPSRSLGPRIQSVGAGAQGAAAVHCNGGDPQQKLQFPDGLSLQFGVQDGGQSCAGHGESRHIERVVYLYVGLKSWPFQCCYMVRVLVRYSYCAVEECVFRAMMLPVGCFTSFGPSKTLFSSVLSFLR